MSARERFWLGRLDVGTEVRVQDNDWRGRVVEAPRRRRSRLVVRVQPVQSSRGGPWWVGVEKVEAVSAVDLLGELS